MNWVPYRSYVTLKLCLNHWEVLFFKPLALIFFSTKHHTYYVVIRAILGDNCNMPAIKTPSPGSHGLFLKGTAWLYNYHSDWQGEGTGGRAAGEEIFSIWMNRSAALDTMLFWPSQGSCDVMPHSHTVSKIPWGQELSLPTNEYFCSPHSRTHGNSSFSWGCSSPFYPPKMLSSVRMRVLEEYFFMIVRGPQVRWPEPGHLQTFPVRVPQMGSRWAER